MSVRSALSALQLSSIRPSSFLSRSGRFATTLAIVSAGAIGVNATAAEDAGAILTKMAKNYQSAKSYSASIITKQKGKTKEGKAFSLTKTQIIKYKTPNLVNVAVSFVGDGEAAGKVAQGDQTVVADGKILIAYSPFRKVYMKKPDLPTVTVMDLLDILKRLPLQGGKNVSTLAPTTVGGRAANVVEIRPMMPPNLTPENQAKWKEAAAKTSPLHLVIDKQTYYLLKITEASAGGSVDVALNDQVFNGNIPNSAFSYTPPAGSKEVAPPPVPQAGGAPGGASPIAPPAPRK